MCKLFIGVGRIPPTTTQQIIDATASAFVAQKDGFGFVARMVDGSIAVGRFDSPESYLLHRRNTNVPKFVKSANGSKFTSGSLASDVLGLIVHGRTSTNRTGLANCHPFEKNGTYLAHNGVLDWIGSGAEPDSRAGCDSDQFLSWYLSKKGCLKKVHKHWSGYGVFGVLSQQSGTLRILKCQAGSLHWKLAEWGHAFTSDKNDFSRIVGPGGSEEVESRVDVMFDLTGNPEDYAVSRWPGFGQRQIDLSWRRSMPTASNTGMNVSNKEVRDTFPDYKPLVYEPNYSPTTLESSK